MAGIFHFTCPACFNTLKTSKGEFVECSLCCEMIFCSTFLWCICIGSRRCTNQMWNVISPWQVLWKAQLFRTPFNLQYVCFAISLSCNCVDLEPIMFLQTTKILHRISRSLLWKLRVSEQIQISFLLNLQAHYSNVKFQVHFLPSRKPSKIWFWTLTEK